LWYRYISVDLLNALCFAWLYCWLLFLKRYNLIVTIRSSWARIKWLSVTPSSVIACCRNIKQQAFICTDKREHWRNKWLLLINFFIKWSVFSLTTTGDMDIEPKNPLCKLLCWPWLYYQWKRTRIRRPTRSRSGLFSNKVHQTIWRFKRTISTCAELLLILTKNWCPHCSYDLDNEASCWLKVDRRIFWTQYEILINGEVLPLTEERLKIMKTKTRSHFKIVHARLAFCLINDAIPYYPIWGTENDLILSWLFYGLIDPPRELSTDCDEAKSPALRPYAVNRWPTKRL